MTVKDLPTRQYGKLIKELVGEFKAPAGDFDGTIEITRLRKFPDSPNGTPRYHDGEIDVVYRGVIMAMNGNYYKGTSFGRGKIRNYFRSNLQKHINMYTRPFGISNPKICKITFA
jgi:hypothetical protein